MLHEKVHFRSATLLNEKQEGKLTQLCFSSYSLLLLLSMDLRPPLATMSSESGLVTPATLSPSFLFITGQAGEMLPTRSASQTLLELQLCHGALIPNSSAMLAYAFRNC